jgi:hypothetical protein
MSDDFAHIGDPDAPVGSPPWCLAAHLNLCIHKHRSDQEVSVLKYGLLEFKNERRWQQLTNKHGKPFRFWKDYVSHPEPYGLGMLIEEADAVMHENNDKTLLRDVLAARAMAIETKANLRRAGRLQKLDGSSIKGFPSGTSVEYAHRRLRKDRPDIHARVMAGELTAYAGMLIAGFLKPKPRKQTDPTQILRRAWKHASPEEREAFLVEISSEIRDGVLLSVG